jgi:hypothetical protein
VTDIQYIGIWTSNGNYFAAFDYQVKNTGLVTWSMVHHGQGEVL